MIETAQTKKVKMNEINQYVLLFEAMDNLVMYLEDNNLAKFIPDKGIYIEPKYKIKRKADRMIVSDVEKLVDLIEKLNQDPLKTSIVDKKWKGLIKGTKDAKAREEYSALPYGLFLLELYASFLNEKDKIFKIHPKRIEKIFYLFKKDVNFKFLDKFMINSNKLANIIFNKLIEKKQ